MTFALTVAILALVQLYAAGVVSDPVSTLLFTVTGVFGLIVSAVLIGARVYGIIHHVNTRFTIRTKDTHERIP